MRSRRVLGSLGVRNNIGVKCFVVHKAFSTLYLLPPIQLCTRTISCAPFYVSSARSAPASQWGRRMYADQAEEEEKPFRSPDFHRVPDIVPEEKLKVYTREEVANHNTPEGESCQPLIKLTNSHCITDCWVIVNKRIYNVSLWSDLHPGGRDVLYRVINRFLFVLKQN